MTFESWIRLAYRVAGEWKRVHRVGVRVPNSPTGQVLEAGPDWPVLVDVDDWTRLTWVVWSGLD